MKKLTLVFIFTLSLNLFSSCERCITCSTRTFSQEACASGRGAKDYIEDFEANLKQQFDSVQCIEN